MVFRSDYFLGNFRGGSCFDDLLFYFQLQETDVIICKKPEKILLEILFSLHNFLGGICILDQLYVDK